MIIITFTVQGFLQGAMPAEGGLRKSPPYFMSSSANTSIRQQVSKIFADLLLKLHILSLVDAYTCIRPTA